MLAVLIQQDLPLDIRGKLSLSKKRQSMLREGLLEICKEIIILSTCNRTEIYVNSDKAYEELIESIFNICNLDKSLMDYMSHINRDELITHLMELSCGFKSKILGEDQILSQLKEAYKDSLEEGASQRELGRLFQQAIACGKRFRQQANLYEIPVSSASIACKMAKSFKAKNYMLIGFGEVGTLAAKYILSEDIEKLYVVVRNKKVLALEDERVEIIDFNEKNDYIEFVDCIISCTSAPHTVLRKEEIPENKALDIFDLAVPRDVEADVGELPNIKLFDIDYISALDDENKRLREERMNGCRYVIESFIEEYKQWIELREIAPHIKKIKAYGEAIYKERVQSYKSKSKSLEDQELAITLIKSTSDAYVNRVIEVLKEEKLRGCGSECMRILEKIFLRE